MFRPHQLSKLRITRLIPPQLVSSKDPVNCTNGFRILAASQSRSIAPSARSFATNRPTRREVPSDISKQSSTSAQHVLPEHAGPEAAGAEPEVQPQPDSTKGKKRRRRGYIYAALFLFLGTSIGSLFRLSISPPPLPLPGTEEDAYVVELIRKKADKLAIVQSLEADPSWATWEAYGGDSADTHNGGETRLTSGPMSGSRGLAYQRIFRNEATGEIVSVVYFGGGVAGWPGVVHGGALATVLDESLGRCAILRFPARTGVTARLEIVYKRPTLTNAFYVVRARPVVAEGDDAVGPDGTRKSDRKLLVESTLETEAGKVCVTAKGIFVVPKNIKLRRVNERF